MRRGCLYHQGFGNGDAQNAGIPICSPQVALSQLNQLRSFSKDVLEPRMKTGSGLFAFLKSGFAYFLSESFL